MRGDGRRGVAFAFAAVILAVLVFGTPAMAQSLVVGTQFGQLHGKLADGNREFLGVPFAAPPVGDLRWRSPQPPASWTGTRDATKFGARCAQNAVSNLN